MTMSQNMSQNLTFWGGSRRPCHKIICQANFVTSLFWVGGSITIRVCKFCDVTFLGGWVSVMAVQIFGSWCCKFCDLLPPVWRQ
jgi:hypothetical protein